MIRWLKEPFLHFLVGGGVLFAAYAWLNPSAPDGISGRRQVRIGPGEVRWLTDTWVRQWHREPTPAELRVLASSLLKEELLSREARELRLDEHDTIVRRRLAQKLEFLLQDTAGIAEPTEDELRRLYDATPEVYRTEPRVSFEQVYFSRGRRTNATKDAADALVTLVNVPSADTGPIGDPLLVEAEFREADRQTVASVFGPEFAAAVFALRPGAWHGPLESGFGAHLVRVSSTDPGRRRAFAEVRPQVRDRWREQKQRENESRFFDQLMSKYDVVIDEGVKSAIGPLTLTLGPR
jgi:parvulin-like peptidyl-prolyl cis-trans isomerase-like protein